MDLNKLSPIAQQAIIKAGGSANRNVRPELVLDSRKMLSGAFYEIAESLAYLKIEFIGNSGEETLYFDLDESIKSKNIRASYFGYKNHLDFNWLNDPDYLESEDFKLTELIGVSVNQKLARIAFFDEEIGCDVFVDASGVIYGAHWDNVCKIAVSIEEFLNKTIIGL